MSATADEPIPAMAWWRRIGLSLFWRIFLVMLASVASVQLVNVALLVFVTPPTPHIFSVAQVASALRHGRDASGEIVLDREDDAPAGRGPRTLHLEQALAAQLGVPIQRVRVHFGGPPGGFHPVMPDFAARRHPRPDARAQILFGGFTVAVREPDGDWIIARAGRTGLEGWRWRALLWLLAALVAVAPFAWMLARRSIAPVKLFAEAAERLGRDPRAAPVPLDGPSEIAEAAVAFNRMQTRLNRYVEDRTTVIAAIAHDLRTPLMRLSLRLEQAPESIRAASEADIYDMQAMIAAGLAFFRDATQSVERRALDLRSLTESIVDDLADRGAAVSLADGDPLVLTGDATGIKAMIGNLVGNALKYAGDAVVTLSQEDGHACIEVRDHGPGIDPDDLDRVFEPFFRGERSRNRDTGGIGLGLASVRGIARAHGGDATIGNHPDGGAIATVWLPL